MCINEPAWDDDNLIEALKQIDIQSLEVSCDVEKEAMSKAEQILLVSLKF